MKGRNYAKMKTYIRGFLLWTLLAALVVLLKLWYNKNIYDVENKNIYDVENKSLVRNITPRKPRVVILLTMMRSGSSIVGSIFNERTNVTYLYEPLFPFGEQRCDEKRRNDSQAVLRHISTCHFEGLPPLYEPSKRYDKNAK